MRPYRRHRRHCQRRLPPVEARGYLAVDVRLDAEGIPYVVNPNPDCPTSHGMHRAVSEAGWTWERFVHAQLEWA